MWGNHDDGSSVRDQVDDRNAIVNLDEVDVDQVQHRPEFSEIARAVDADGRAVAAGAVDAAQHWRGHVAPAGDEGGEAAGGAADDEQVDVVGARHDRDVRVR